MPPKTRILFWVALSLLAGSVGAEAKTIQITMQNVAFAPADVSAQVGDTIEWVNKDPFVHTATARNGEWDIVIPAKKTKTQVLKKAGTIDYYCRFHPNMKGRLTIAPPGS